MRLAILGIRGVPAAHGGFETFAEYLSLYLVGKGWEVTVYCQEDGHDEPPKLDSWKGVQRVIIGTTKEGAKGTMVFDWRSVTHVLKNRPDIILTLGYNTAAFLFPLKLSGIPNIINMDGIEWKRDKWKPHERLWLWLNERLGCFAGDHLIADHPEIANHLATRIDKNKITTIPYGAPVIREANKNFLTKYGLEANQYAIVIARPEPENSILDIVTAFSSKQRNQKLIMLGNYDFDNNEFHKQVQSAASKEVLFPGAIYEKEVVEALRFYARLYIHGHRVGGTNPSLVEALGAGSAVLAHDNKFNRWVAGSGACFFSNDIECSEQLDSLLSDTDKISAMRKFSQARHLDTFQWPDVLAQYEASLLKHAKQ